MDLLSDLVACVVAVATAVVAPQVAPLERQIERSYQVTPGTTVAVELSGGRISVVPGQGRSVEIRLVQRVHTANEREADAALADYTVDFSQQEGTVRLVARRKRNVDFGVWRRIQVNMNAEIAVPADVRLDLNTSGGSIEIRGLRDAPVRAHTSGGSITVDGGTAPISVNTSGGSIRVGHIGQTLRAHTSGGSIRVAQVGATATDVDVNTSGGSVRVGVDPAARLTVDGSTSGGSVSIDGLALRSSHRSRTHVAGELNGGGGRLKASTSGGSVRITGSESANVRD
jgi:DUF4097 and DUF4098 domain-containing protein YvlB